MKGQQMNRRVCELMVGALALALCGIAMAAGDAKPWVHSFTPKRTLYVSPEGAGDGESKDAPISLSKAVATALPGDLYWLQPGVYKTGEIKLTRAGTKENPIVYRGVPGQRVQVVGWIEMMAAYSWVWGIEVTNPGATGHVAAKAPGAHIINNVIHHNGNASVGIGGWQNGRDHVYYGNIIYQVGHHPTASARAYPIYTQSDFERDGYKYIVQNMFLDSRADTGGPGFNFHGYTQGGQLTGFHLRQNILSRGGFLIGGKNLPSHHNVVESNYFYDCTVQIGYRRPAQVEFRDNYLGRSDLQARQYWGVSQADIAKPLPNVYTGNTIATLEKPPAPVLLITSAYKGNAQVPENYFSRIDPKDVFDNNTYMGGFRAYLKADGHDRGGMGLDFEGWKRESASDGGTAFDAHSKVVPPPDAPFVVVLPNEYEEGRGHVAIFNWGKAANVTADLASILKRGASFRIAPAKNPFDKVTLEGKYEGPVQVPMDKEEFAAFLVCATDAKR
jgi:hypothetical protein